ncbi:MAG: response regulator [Bacteroidetes bacterium]|nr:MAG: response regulator [Bacteroidota bacterium]
MRQKVFSFELRIIVILSLVLAMVTAIGVFTFNSLHGIIIDAKEATQPNSKIDLLKQVVGDLTDAESSMKSYRLTNDDSYLTPFYESISQVDGRMALLKQQSSGDEYQVKLADSVAQLVEIKYSLLNRLLLLENNEKVADELQKIAQKLSAQEKQRQKDASKKSTNIFDKIFGPSKKEDKKSGLTIKDVEKEINKAKTNQLSQLKELKEQELYLTKEDKIVMDKIRSLIKKMENFERTSNSRKAIKITKQANQTNFYIIIFCVLATGLLAVTSFFILSYSKKNKAYRAALRDAKIQAENLAKTKETFLANMSHEIRTPMNAIAGFTGQLLQSKLTKEQKEQLQIVKKSSDHLLRIINDILDYSKIQSGKLGFESVGFKPAELLHESALLMQPAATDKGLKIQTSVSDAVPEICIGDPVRLRQIILNLMANAIKFTEKGEVSVRFTALPKGTDAVSLQVTVQDTGIGIEEEKLKTIFNEFEQADSSNARKYGGTGLGLTISKKLTELLEGSIDLSSVVGKGTRVTVIIPYAIGTESDLETTEVVETKNSELKGISILVADDEEYNRRLISTILKKWGVEVTVVNNGAEAVGAVINHTYTAVLMDVRMPVLSGIEATKQIRQLPDPNKAQLTIIALTATTQQAEIEGCKQAGMQHVLSKPFNEGRLYRLLVNAAVNKPDEQANTDNDAAEAKSAENADKKYDLEELRALSNGDINFVREMVQVFITTTQSGIAGMETALAQEDSEALADAAHKIVPPCRHLQANTLLKKLKTIELSAREQGSTLNMEAEVADAKAEAALIIGLLETELKHL